MLAYRVELGAIFTFISRIVCVDWNDIFPKGLVRLLFYNCPYKIKGHFIMIYKVLGMSKMYPAT